MLYAIFLFVEVEKVFVIIVESEHWCIVEVIECTAFLLRWTACAALAVDESRYASHLKDFVLLSFCDILIYLRQHLCAYALLYAIENAEGICDR